jgi:hypothetical protein
MRAVPSPVIELNRAAAVAMRDGPVAGLALIDTILARGDLADYPLAHSARAELCRRLRKTGDARTPEQIAAGRAFYNYEYVNPGLEDLSGDSVFFKDDAGQILHTYSTYGRGGEEFLGIYRYLDATPKGRSGKGGLVEGTGRYHQPGCGCTVHQPAGVR